MVRVNIVEPSALADQHLVAEFDEILMLIGYVRNYPEPNSIPKNYTLGKGHMKFFKDKLLYLKRRHDDIRKEMINRGYKPKAKLRLSGIKRSLLNNWKPEEKDALVIKERIISKLRLKPEYYRYYGEKKGLKFLVSLIEQARIW